MAEKTSFGVYLTGFAAAAGLAVAAAAIAEPIARASAADDRSALAYDGDDIAAAASRRYYAEDLVALADSDLRAATGDLELAVDRLRRSRLAMQLELRAGRPVIAASVEGYVAALKTTTSDVAAVSAEITRRLDAVDAADTADANTAALGRLGEWSSRVRGALERENASALIFVGARARAGNSEQAGG